MASSSSLSGPSVASMRREPTLTLFPSGSGDTGERHPGDASGAAGHSVRDDRGLCAFVRKPPIETVAFGWGVNEDGQLGLMETRSGNEKGEKGQSSFVMSPKVVEGLLGTKFRGRVGSRSPIVAGSRNTMVVTADGQVYVVYVFLQSLVVCIFL